MHASFDEFEGCLDILVGYEQKLKRISIAVIGCMITCTVSIIFNVVTLYVTR